MHSPALPEASPAQVGAPVQQAPEPSRLHSRLIFEFRLSLDEAAWTMALLMLLLVLLCLLEHLSVALVAVEVVYWKISKIEDTLGVKGGAAPP